MRGGKLNSTNPHNPVKSFLMPSPELDFITIKGFKSIASIENLVEKNTTE
jgi:hypothetical protein